MNVYDSERMVDVLKPLGYTLTDNVQEADLAILNTCHIREKAEQKVYSDLGRLRLAQNTQKSKMMIAVGGCVAQAEGQEIIRQAPYVDLVFGPQTYHRLPEMIAQATRAADPKSGKRKGGGIVDIDFPTETKFDAIPTSDASPVAAYLTVQEGCDKFCTYCVVPYTRGAEYSRSAAEILKEARHQVAHGTREITLLGQNVNAYHGEGLSGKTEWSLARLIQELAEIDGLERIRYTTSHPSDMADDLILAHRDIPQLMPYLHLPVQSGSNRILQGMNRKHTRESYLQIMDKLRQARPDIALSSDFIVGFPGETDAEFEETLDLVQQVCYAQAYSFKYSIRPGTPAGLMDTQVPEDVKSARLQQLQTILNTHQQEFNEHTVGKTLRVLLERHGKNPGQIIGRSPYMQSVIVKGSERLFGEIVDVYIKEAHPNSIIGEVVTNEWIGTAARAI